jgi:hypothetical protein
MAALLRSTFVRGVLGFVEVLGIVILAAAAQKLLPPSFAKSSFVATSYAICPAAQAGFSLRSAADAGAGGPSLDSNRANPMSLRPPTRWAGSGKP